MILKNSQPIQKKYSTRGGFLIIEVLLAIVILSMIFLTLFSMLSFLTNRTERSKYDAQASSLLQEGVEVARNSLLLNWNRNPGKYYPLFDVDSSRWTLMPGQEGLLQGRFTREVVVSSVCRGNPEGVEADCATHAADPQSKAVTVKISWKEADSDKSITARLVLFQKQ